MRRADRLALLPRRPPETAPYDVVLLAGTPRRRTLWLGEDVTAESEIEVDGERWLVADVRPAGAAPKQLICIHAD